MFNECLQVNAWYPSPKAEIQPSTMTVCLCTFTLMSTEHDCTF